VCSLGYDLVDWIQAYECHGPGDVQGDPIVLDDEWFAFLIEAYRIDSVTGRRVFNEAVLSRPKGRAKSELAGFVGVGEAFGPVRFDGWDAAGQPVGRPVRSPLLKCLATEESQAGNTFENIAFIAAEWGPDVHPEIYAGVSGIRQYQSATALYLPHGGEIRACTAGNASKDGGKETWACADETHLYVLRELKSMFGTVSRNLGKRKIAQPWLMQTTTMYRLGEQSVAEETLTAWRKGELPASTYVDHREPSGRVNSETLADRDYTLAQLREVYGPAAEWMDLERIYVDMRNPRVCEDDAQAARYFLNRGIPAADGWIDLEVVRRQARTEVVEPGTAIALGFDGSLNDDSTVLIGSRMSDGFLFPVGIWEKPTGRAGLLWEVPRSDVLATVREAFGRYTVVRMYADPHEWRSDVDSLSEELGVERVLSWETRRDVQMAAALDRLFVDLHAGTLWHSGDPRFVEHFGNAYERRKGGHRLVRKEHDQSPRKIDSVVGAALAGEARADAIEAKLWPPRNRSVRVR
jgi:phage terminase large subunit-like protein